MLQYATQANAVENMQSSLGTRVALSPGLGIMRDVTSAIISHEQNQTESAVFKLCMLYFQRISSDYLEITTAVGERGGSVVECRTPEREVGGSKPTAAVLCP